ncbi:MAG TPA: helix-turn-helix domain-containing protein [Streptosporangiaceae bacterium]|nr:helix-turn-helix domain-containing protein [Streptosporangiaceae bacterium]
MGIGETLATQREDAGLTVAEVSARTRIRETIIRAIEREDYSLCGGNFYARGYIRAIGRVLGIDPEPLVREYDDTHGGAPQAVSALTALEPVSPVRFRERRAPNWTAAMALALALVVAYGVFQVFKTIGSHPARVVQVNATTSPTRVRSRGTRALVVPRTEVTLQLKAKQPTWINVRDERGNELFSGTVSTGELREWVAKKKIQLIVGNAAGVDLTVNGTDIGAPGTEARVLTLSYGLTDPATA